MTLRSWCEAQGISYSAMRYWQRIFSTAKSQPKQNQDLQWIPLTSAVPAENHLSPPAHSHGSTLIKVSIGKCVVDIPENFQPDQLYSLLKVLNAL